MELDLAKLGRFVADQFDLDQLQALCQELGVAYDQLLGATRPARAFDLVTLMRDQGQLSALVSAVARMRPDEFNPARFQVPSPRERTERQGIRWLAPAGGGLALALLVAVYFLLFRRPASAPALAPAEALSLTPLSTTPMQSPSSAPTAFTATPSPIPATPTIPAVTQTASHIPPTPTPTPTASPSPSHTPTLTVTLALTPTLAPSATPVLSPSSASLSYDPETRTLRLAPGDVEPRGVRLCTPLNAYQIAGVVYVIDSVADALALPLPAQARITHSYPERLTDSPVARTVEVRRHPIEGVKVTGEQANFLGCDLVIAEDLRLALGFPTNLGEFDDPPRFDHGWITIQFLTPTPNP